MDDVELTLLATKDDIASYVRRSYLVSSQTEFEAKLTKCEDFMRSAIQSENSDGLGETLLRMAAFLQWNPSFNVPDSFVGRRAPTQILRLH
jgi:hypothetical protein